MPIPLTKAQIANSIKLLNEIEEIDEKRKKTIERRNFFESLLYENLQLFENNLAINQFITQQEKLDLIKELSALKTWFEDDGYLASLEQIEEKISQVELNLLNQRKNEYDSYIKACDTFIKEMNSHFQKGLKLAEVRPWTRKFFEKNFTETHRDIFTWFDELKAKQDFLKFYEVKFSR